MQKNKASMPNAGAIKKAINVNVVYIDTCPFPYT